MKTTVLSLVFLLPITAFAQPKLKVLEGTSIDLGQMSRGNIAEKTLTIKNIGTEELVLGKIDVSCGCTGTVVSDERIQPGKTGTLLITFNSKNFSGPVNKRVTVNSNSEGTPQTVVEFSANVIEEVSLSPAQFWFRDAEVGRASSTSITVRNQGNSELAITGFKTQMEGLTITLPSEPIKPGKSAEIVAELTPKTVRKVMSEVVIVTTSHPSQPELYVYVLGNVKEFKFQ